MAAWPGRVPAIAGRRVVLREGRSVDTVALVHAGTQLRLLCGFLRRDPLGNLEPGHGRGLVMIMERPLEGSGRCLDLDHTAGQFQDLIARRRPRRPVNGNDLDGRALAEHTPPAPAEIQAPCGERRHAYPPPAGQPRLVSVDDPEPAPDAT
jgi:hypothetical protein